MLIPPPEADLSESPLVIGADILEIIGGRDGIVVEDVMLKFLELRSSATPEEFMDALCCLYSLGLLEYDAFRLKEQEP